VIFPLFSHSVSSVVVSRALPWSFFSLSPNLPKSDMIPVFPFSCPFPCWLSLYLGRGVLTLCSPQPLRSLRVFFPPLLLGHDFPSELSPLAFLQLFACSSFPFHSLGFAVTCPVFFFLFFFAFHVKLSVFFLSQDMPWRIFTGSYPFSLIYADGSSISSLAALGFPFLLPLVCRYFYVQLRLDVFFFYLVLFLVSFPFPFLRPPTLTEILSFMPLLVWF